MIQLDGWLYRIAWCIRLALWAAFVGMIVYSAVVFFRADSPVWWGKVDEPGGMMEYEGAR